ncbi:hypothetical protein LX32DRAFT_251018 [Colletotrichum zoysiae]|uniref:Uncharacterized protein n=1 Tax=Colletotrichum zoysiae TaxID=1216348 RepID=A0AAD9H3K1_9PEZI|nr:hypothetical protein LX32DRAFT_251018 [Colletotrichum zoysiae]
MMARVSARPQRTRLLAGWWVWCCVVLSILGTLRPSLPLTLFSHNAILINHLMRRARPGDSTTLLTTQTGRSPTRAPWRNISIQMAALENRSMCHVLHGDGVSDILRQNLSRVTKVHACAHVGVCVQHEAVVAETRHPVPSKGAAGHAFVNNICGCTVCLLTHAWGATETRRANRLHVCSDRPHLIG